MPSKPNKPAEPVRPAMVQEKAEPSAPAAAPTVLLTDDTEEQVADYRILGELFATYIMVEYKDTFVLIDKHAAQSASSITACARKPAWASGRSCWRRCR